MTTPAAASRSVSPSIHEPGKPYILGTGGDETFRLGLQHRLWSAAAHALWEKSGVQPGSTVMDVGCGPGHATMDLSQIVGPNGRVIAVDESAAFLKQVLDGASARRVNNVERVLGDVQELGECLEGNESIDVAYARWVFCFVSDPEAVITGLKPFMKKGARLAVHDYFNYERSMTLAPRREAFTKVVQAVAASWRSRGGDTDVMGKLPGLLVKHGFKITHMDVLQRIARPGTTMWHWPDSFFHNFIPKLVQGGFITDDEATAALQAWTDAGRDPASFIQLPPVYELIAEKL
ncbi:MAG: methyltransferase domain-containing protein [Phycisphaerae bacterium]|jgi:ubiquinone/menaquinone biosynthesis C-methylase UbiE